MSNVDINEIFRLRDEDHLVDNIVEINLDVNKAPRVQETDKRNILIQDAEDHGCSHCLVIDSDEYYTKKAFEYGLQQIDENDYEMTYCQYVNYYHDYRHYLVYPFQQGMYVPWVTKTKYRHSFECKDFDLPSDPTRRFIRTSYIKDENGNLQLEYEKDENGQLKRDKFGRPVKKMAPYHLFEWNEVKMHHLSWLRADIRKKLESWSSKTVFKNYDDLIDKAVMKFEQFDTNPEEGKQALMLFNTPGHRVNIEELPKQFIWPKADFHTRLRPAADYKKLLFLSMSADMSPFNELEEACNKTWRNVEHEKYPNIDAEFWTYTDAAPGKSSTVDMKNHIIYIKRDTSHKNMIDATYSKTIEAFLIITEKLNLQFDYLIRTNNSTWINVPLINEFLAYCKDDSMWYGAKLYSAFHSAFNPYIGGQLMIISRRNLNVLRTLCGSVEEAKAFERQYVSCDDNMMFSKINQRQIHLRIPYNKTYHTIGGLDLIEKTVPDVLDFSIPEFQVKTYNITREERPQYDINKMLEVDKKWRESEHNIKELYNKMMAEHYDKTVTILKPSKKEWFELDEQTRLLYKFNSEVPRQEAWEFLTVHQKKCGYGAGIFQ